MFEIGGNVVTVGLGPAGPGKPWAKAGVPSWGSNRLQYDAPADPGAGQLRDLAGNAVGNMRSIALDNLTETPAVTGVAVSSDAGTDRTYALGETVRVAVTFNEAVHVTGAPRLKLDLGSGDGRWAVYESGGGTAALVFAWTVAAGDASNAGVAVLANTLALNGGSIRSAASGEDAALAHPGLPHDATHKVDAALPDTTPPRLSATEVNGETLTLAFNEAIDAAVSPASGAFTVKRTPSGGSEQNVRLSGAPAVEGARVTLTLATAVRDTDTDVKVSYRKAGSEAGDRLRDAGGNEVASFSNEPVTNNTPDTTPPRLVRGEIDGGTVTLIFSEALDPDSKGGHFWVQVKAPTHSWSSNYDVGNAQINGNVVKFAVGGHHHAIAGLSHNPFAYFPPTDPTKGLRDVAGNAVKTPVVSCFISCYLSTRTIELDNVTGVALTVTGVEVSSDAGGDATYGLGDTIRVRLTFNRAVVVTGVPRVKIDFSTAAGDEKWADYTRSDGMNTLEFTYTVAENDASSAGVSVLANTLALNGGAIRSSAGADAVLSHAGLGPDPAHRVDWRRSRVPTVTDVAISSDAGPDDTYVQGETITVRLTFSEAVTVTGTPRVKLDFGYGTAGGKWAYYESGGGTTMLEFAYKVAEGDAAGTGVAVLAETLALNGGTIRSAATQADADRVHTGLDHDSTHKVDGTAPTLFQAAVDGVTLTLIFDETLSAAASLASGAFTVKKTPQGGSEQEVGLSGTPAISGAAVTLTLSNAVLETDTDVKVSYTKATTGTGNRLRDEAGNEAAGFTGQPVRKGPPDITPPRLLRGEIDGGTVTVYFSEALDPDSMGGYFRVVVYSSDDSSHSFTARGDIEISGNVVTVGLGPAARERPWAKAGVPSYSWAANQIWYIVPADPDAKRLRDFAGNAVDTPGHFSGVPRRTRIIFLDNLTGVARLSVADARANEGAGATVAFEVSLSSAAAETVTVDYATADGTAEAGADYTASSGTLTFAAGETSKTVSVPVLDDAVDEGEETFTLRLSNAQGGWITDGEAVGTITNDDPLQKMWLSRFGRTVASHVTGAVSDRVTAPLAGAQVTVGGQRVDLAQTEDGAALRQALTAVARVLGVSEGAAGEAGPDRFGAGGWAATGAGIGGSREAGRTTTRDLTGGELLHGSAFHLAEGGDGTRLGLAAWGRVTVGGFAGEAPADAGSVRIDGEVVTGILGADAVWEPLLVGVAVAVSEGEGGYDQPGVDQGTVASTMTTVSPYARLRLHDRLAVWGLAGWGTGDMTIVQAANERGQPQRVTRTDLTLRLAGLGGRGALLAAGESGGIDLGLKADAFWAETEAAAVSNEGGTRAEASRVRLALEGGRAFEMGGGAVLTPSAELGVRHDVGDAETGTGVEVGGRVAWEYAEAGLSVEAGGARAAGARGLGLPGVGSVGCGAAGAGRAGPRAVVQRGAHLGRGDERRAAAVDGGRRAGAVAGGRVRGRTAPGGRGRLRARPVRRPVHGHADGRLRALGYGARGPPRLAADVVAAGRHRVRGQPRRQPPRGGERHRAVRAPGNAQRRHSLVTAAAFGPPAAATAARRL